MHSVLYKLTARCVPPFTHPTGLWRGYASPFQAPQSGLLWEETRGASQRERQARERTVKVCARSYPHHRGRTHALSGNRKCVCLRARNGGKWVRPSTRVAWLFRRRRQWRRQTLDRRALQLRSCHRRDPLCFGDYVCGDIAVCFPRGNNHGILHRQWERAIDCHDGDVAPAAPHGLLPKRLQNCSGRQVEPWAALGSRPDVDPGHACVRHRPSPVRGKLHLLGGAHREGACEGWGGVGCLGSSHI